MIGSALTGGGSFARSVGVLVDELVDTDQPRDRDGAPLIRLRGPDRSGGRNTPTPYRAGSPDVGGGNPFFLAWFSSMAGLAYISHSRGACGPSSPIWVLPCACGRSDDVVARFLRTKRSSRPSPLVSSERIGIGLLPEVGNCRHRTTIQQQPPWLIPS